MAKFSMKMSEYVEEIRLELTGGVIELGIDDKTVEKIVLKSLREIQRYINETKLITIPFSRCIDMSGFDVSCVCNVYRTSGYAINQQSDSKTGGISDLDPMVSQWMIYSAGYTMYNLQDWLLNYSAYNVLQQIQNTTGTDLAYEYNKSSNKLYINVVDSNPDLITIKYIPKFEDPEDIKSDYWIDILQRLSIAYTKIILGRIRTRFKMSTEVWSGDGETILAEGQEELKAIQETLRTNSQVTYAVD